MKYENINKFAEKAGCSTRNVYRFYSKNSDLRTEVNKKSRPYRYPLEHLKYFSSEIMFEENKVMALENQSMRNLIDGLLEKDSLAKTFWFMDWTFFYTIAYKAERNKKSCFRMMNAVFEQLVNKYESETDLRMFFTTEPFTNRKGYHNHFVLYIENKKLREQIVTDIEAFFMYDRIDSKRYDCYKAGLFYVAKEGLVNEDWDVLTHNKKDNHIEDEV